MVNLAPRWTGGCRAALFAALVATLARPVAAGTAIHEADFETGEICTAGWYIVVGEVPDCVCSNTIVDPGEECDDGNLGSGDGCSSSCLYEPVAESEPNDDGAISIGGGATGNDFSSANANGPFPSGLGNRLIAAAITPAGDEDCFAVVNDSGGPRLLSAETFGASWGTCAAVDTILVARNAAGAVITSDDESGINSCSKLSDLALAAGETIYLQALDFGDNSTIASYRLEIRFSTPP